MARDLRVGIDVGTAYIKVVVAERPTESRELPKIIAVGRSETKGMRRGYVVEPAEVTESVRLAIEMAERGAQAKIRRVFLGAGGISLSSLTSVGTAMISRGDNEVTELDVRKAGEDAQKRLPPSDTNNRKILHAIPLGYRIDGKDMLGRPTGQRGVKLDARMLFITALDQHLDNLLEAVEAAGVEVEDVMASPVAASLVSISKTQKVAGGALVNIGAETTSIAVYENDVPLSFAVFPLGGTAITNDIALGLKISLEEAEAIKLGRVVGVSYSRKKLDEIVAARLSDIFEMVDAHLKKIGRDGLLPAGVILLGGGAGIGEIDEVAREVLRLPARIVTFPAISGGKSALDGSYAVAYGLCVFGFSAEGNDDVGENPFRSLSGLFGKLIKQILP